MLYAYKIKAAKVRLKIEENFTIIYAKYILFIIKKRSSVGHQKKTKRLLEILPKIRIIPTILEETEDYFGIFSFLV